LILLSSIPAFITCKSYGRIYGFDMIAWNGVAGTFPFQCLPKKCDGNMAGLVNSFNQVNRKLIIKIKQDF